MTHRFFELVAVLLLFVSGCSGQSSPEVREAASATEIGNAVLARGLEAHGGLETWNSYGTLRFTLERDGDREEHLFDLKNRKLLITAEKYRLGFDGTDVWVAPNTAVFDGRPVFYSSLFFYFFAIPYVLADPGTIYETVENLQIAEQACEAVKVSYEAGVGESPDDYYVACFDPETDELEWVLYTVTYEKDGPTDNYNALRYRDMQQVGGLLFPTRLTGYHWLEDSVRVGEQRYEVMFSDISLSADRPDPSVFEKPHEADIASD